MTNHNGRQPSPPEITAWDVRQFSYGVLTLFELQVALLKADVQESLNDCRRGMVLLVGGALVGVSSIPILLIAVAQALHHWAGFSWAAAYFGATVVGLLLAAAGIFVGWRMLRRGLAVFNRSRTEYRTNLAWVRSVLSGKTPGHHDCEHIHQTRKRI